MSSPPPPIGNGRYGLITRLGSGFFGEVWRARDNLQGDEVAVKLLGREVTLDAALLEARLLTRLRTHDRIVTIRNVELAPPVPFIAMDYLPAGSVGQRLDMGVVTLVDAVRWTRDALDGLAYAHSLGVIHRDIKPDNVLLDAEERAVLSDFGIAEDTVHNLLAAPHVYVKHKAPEADAHGSSQQTDIWAMGCTLYRLLVGRYPFETEEAASRGVFIPAHRLSPQVPMAVTRVLQRALAVDPTERYADAGEMLTALLAPEVRHCWTPVSDPQAMECWAAQTPDGTFQCRLTEGREGGFAVAVTRDKGSGPRHVVRETFTRRGAAVRVRRNCLLALVGTGTVP